MATLALAAAAVLTPLVVLAGNALPGEPLYPVKLTVESVRLSAAHWSPRQRADLRTHFASTRLHELHSLWYPSRGSLPTRRGRLEPRFNLTDGDDAPCSSRLPAGSARPGSFAA